MSGTPVYCSFSDSEDLRKKLFSSILLVGGGLQFEGAMTWLQYQVWQSMPASTRQQLETMDIITKPKVIFTLY